MAVVFSKYWDYVGAVVPTDQASFTDTQNHWAELYINKFFNAGVTVGFGDGTFRPNEGTKREQVVVMVNKIIARAALERQNPSFLDTPNVHWAFGDIEAAIAYEKQAPEMLPTGDGEEEATDDVFKPIVEE